ncbi:MAG: hypothetical protein QM765_14215 [Myxococcales bacterium]
MFSAPEFAEYLIASTRLSREDQTRLVYHWLDRCIRVHAAKALERCERTATAERLRRSAKIRDEATLQSALAEFTTAIGPAPEGGAPSASDVDACYFCLAGNLPISRTEVGYDFASVIVTILTAARCAGAEDEERVMLAEAGARHGLLH